MEINLSAEKGGASDTLTSLQTNYVEVGEVDPSCGPRYHEALDQARREKGEELTLEEIRKVVDEVNMEVKLERLSECKGREGGKREGMGGGGRGG